MAPKRPNDSKIKDSKGTIKRSRNGCHNCKRLKIKCDEIKPKCSYCVKSNIDCDYSIRLTWGGRPYKDEKKRQNQMFKMMTPVEDSPKPKRAKPAKPKSGVQFVMNRSASYPEHTNDQTTAMSRSKSEPQVKIENLPENLTLSNDKFSDFMAREIGSPEPASPASFNTPQGVSILSAPYMEENASDINMNYINDLASKRTLDMSSILSNMPELSTGIEDVSNALERVVDGGHQFGLHNSEIFNRFLSSNVEEPVVSDTQSSEADFLTNYANDIAKVDAYFPRQTSNAKAAWLTDFASPSSILDSTVGGPSPRYQKIEFLDEEGETGDEIVPLDSEQTIATPILSYIESIPPPLAPLPELLNQVSYYKQLMHFWVTVGADNLVPAPSHIYEENPFKVILPQMAMEYPAILTTILALSAISKALITGLKPPTEIMNQLVARSCTMLLKMLQNKEQSTSDAALATVLLLSCYETFVSSNLEKHRAHNSGARQIIMARRLPNDLKSLLKSHKSSVDLLSSVSTVEGDITFFLMRWFVYIDVMGALSATRNALYYLNQPEYNYFIADSLSNFNSPDSEEQIIDPKRDIDYIFGFDAQFLSHFTDIVMLIRNVESYLDANGDRRLLPVEIITKAIEVRSEFAHTYSKGEARRQEIIDKMSDNSRKTQLSHGKTKRIKNLIQQDYILRCTNKLFYNVGLLNLYRRVLLVPRESQIIQDLAYSMGSVLCNDLKLKSSAEVCTIFCHFCAACDTLDQDMRQMFKARFTVLAESGNVHAAKSLQIMNRCWETGQDWIEASRDLDIDITLL